MELLLPPAVSETLRQLSFRLPVEAPVQEIPHLLNETVLEGGKRLRPALCLLMGGVFGVPAQRLGVYARAAELTHAASLAHDDVIDEAKLRRDRETLNSRASNSRAVLAGDLLLARVMVEVAEVGPLIVIQDLARAVEDLVRGEWLQDSIRGSVVTERETLDEVARLKTGALLRWCAMVGPRLAGASPARVEAAGKFGEAVGLAFQWVDDVIDFEPGAGKKVGKDLAEGWINAVAFELLDARPELIVPMGQVLGKDRPASEWPWSPEELERAQERVRARTQEKLNEARTLLQELTGPQSDLDCVASLNFLFEHLASRRR